MLISENYRSKENENKYMSVSQFKGFLECEEKQLAVLMGVYENKKSPDMLAGSYVHAYVEGTLEDFKLKNPEMFTNKGELYATYKKLDKVTNVIDTDENIKKALTGEKERIFTAEIFGIPWKCQIDVINQEKGFFTDLKVLKDIHKKVWLEESKCYGNVFEARKYYLQLAVYAEIIKRSTNSDSYLQPHIAAVTKEDTPNKIIIAIDGGDESSIDSFVSSNLEYVNFHIERIKKIKSGEIEPIGCNVCDYCRQKETKIIHYTKINDYFNI